MSQEQFAAFLGITQDTVRGWIQTDTVPRVKIAGRNFVNLELMSRHLRDGKDIFTKGDYAD
ncbi:hypothetical protein CHH28_17405 [Bacterioplanes sanyensis]|uniref:Helix-turn-helix domain-containing protein n=2 Tax=Bacterioplanes sanyensis TaxID=1249553 RepID=A0A222FQB0_9GAMM|nr:hypothetical protein CHH28_17405 [Bacterioplanes sanyensis]